MALGAVETGLITAASAQMARYYGLPCRSVGAATESKREDLQAGMERTATLVQAVLAGVNFITCAGTLDGTMLESEPLLLLDDELCGAALRMARGIEVNDDTLALDLIRRVGYAGNYFAENHTVDHYRTEHYIPRLAVREPYETWEKNGGRLALDHARAACARSWRATSRGSSTRRWPASWRITADGGGPLARRVLRLRGRGAAGFVGSLTERPSRFRKPRRSAKPQRQEFSKCKSANLATATWKSRPSGSAA